MQKIIKTSAAILFAVCITGCTAKSQSETPRKQYLEMTEAEQRVELDKLIQHSIQSDKLRPQHPNVKTTYVADTDDDMFYVIGTYNEDLSEEKIKQALKGFEKKNAGVKFCEAPDVIAMTAQGLGHQAIMKDLSGKLVYESEACRGATSTASKLRG